MEQNQSEVARTRQRLATEEQAMRQGFTGPAIVSQHDAINRRATRGAERILRLVEQGQYAKAEALMNRPDWGMEGEASVSC